MMKFIKQEMMIIIIIFVVMIQEQVTMCSSRIEYFFLKKCGSNLKILRRKWKCAPFLLLSLFLYHFFHRFNFNSWDENKNEQINGSCVGFWLLKMQELVFRLNVFVKFFKFCCFLDPFGMGLTKNMQNSQKM